MLAVLRQKDDIPQPLYFLTFNDFNNIITNLNKIVQMNVMYYIKSQFLNSKPFVVDNVELSDKPI